ncbi:unnamed protein product [Protopolystoma xenopodis]|uniref:Uncharacterized protein n=1 Tax=Protopolystoma xenopodis TaxID=117903 RepID=A0A448WZW2_9PLAT|nr:unnamed protein product [Protopolystoma xenopodis]
MEWRHGEFDKLNAETVEAEVDEYWREISRLQKLFTARIKKQRMELEEKRREMKKRRKPEMAMDEAGALLEAGATEEEELEDIRPPAALDTISTVQENIRKFRVSHMEFYQYCVLKIKNYLFAAKKLLDFVFAI